MSKKYLFVFDIETIPDTECTKNLTGLDLENIIDQRSTLTDYHLEITEGRNPFLRQLFHKVIVISYILCEIDQYDHSLENYKLKYIKSGGNLDSTEEELVKGFFDIIEKYKPRIVSFNGRTFDIPVLKYRAMKYGISANYFYKAGDKWSNYNQRYSVDWNCDLLDVLSDFGSSARIKLNEICSILGFPGKFGIEGSLVTELYDGGKIKEIREYCETDVLNTYLVYLRYMLHVGKLTVDNYNYSIEEILKFFQENKEKKYLQDFKNAWEEASKNKFTL